MTKRPETGSHKGHNYYSRMIIPNHKSFPNENKQKTKFISLISKYSRTHTITTSVFECDIPLDLWHSLKGCKKDIWRYPRGTISTHSTQWREQMPADECFSAVDWGRHKASGFSKDYEWHVSLPWHPLRVLQSQKLSSISLSKVQT
jgi:hypothetical protein